MIVSCFTFADGYTARAHFANHAEVEKAVRFAAKKNLLLVQNLGIQEAELHTLFHPYVKPHLGRCARVRANKIKRDKDAQSRA